MLDPFLWIAAGLNWLAGRVILIIKLAFLVVFVKLMVMSLVTEWWLWMS